MKVPKQKIEQMFALNTTRAVDRIFTENRVEGIHEFYKSLQDYKRSNTSSLRSTLSGNYEKMLYCSDILDKIKDYAQVIKGVALKITDQVEPRVDNSEQDTKTDRVIDQIEQKLKKREFAMAMQRTIEAQQGSASLCGSDRYYLNILQVDIIRKLENQVGASRLTQNKLNDYIRCLDCFLFEQNQATKNKALKVSSLKRLCCDYNADEILGIINKLIQKNNPHTFFDSKKALTIEHEIIFEYKLTLIKKQCCQSKAFEEYFEDLTTLLAHNHKLSENEKGEDSMNSIYVESIPNIRAQLASIFISKKTSGEIEFKCDLYDQLVGSENFKTILNKFHFEISKCGVQVESPIIFIQELWHEYFINLVDFSLDEVDPCSQINTLTLYSKNYNSVPRQLKPFLYDQSKQQSLALIEKYTQKLRLFHGNILSALSRCSSEQVKLIADNFEQKFAAIVRRCSSLHFSLLDSLGNAENDLDCTTLALRKMVLHLILCDLLNQQILNINSKFAICSNVGALMKIFDGSNFGGFWKVFQHGTKGSGFEEVMSRFDAFFIGYLENSGEPHPKDSIKQSIQKIVISMLESMLQSETGRTRQLLEHNIESLKQKKQKVSILEYIVTPYIAANVFDCSIKPVNIEEGLFNQYFMGKSIDYGSPMVEQENSNFEIGEKEETDDIVKIGKSLMSLGNNFISGFMPKKK